MATIRKSVGLLIIVFVLCGFIFPLTVTAIGQVIFPHQANGSLIKQDGKVIGSELIGQQWTATKYFHGRISAVNYNMNGQQLKANSALKILLVKKINALRSMRSLHQAQD